MSDVRSWHKAQGIIFWSDAPKKRMLPNYIHVRNGHCLLVTTREGRGSTEPDLPIFSDCCVRIDIFMGYYGFDMKCSPRLMC